MSAPRFRLFAGLAGGETMADALKALRKRDAKLPRDATGLFRRAK